MLRTFLELSTSHVSEATSIWLNARGKETADGDLIANPAAWVASTVYGWFVYADEDPSEDDFPADLITLFKHAREQGAEYILFDCDAGTIDGLPTFDW